MTDQARTLETPAHLQVGLLGPFRVLAGPTDITVSGGTQRLLAYLALKGCWVKRALVAGTLWPDASETRAHASLRSALARMEQTIRSSVEVTSAQLRLCDDVRVDVNQARASALRLLAPDAVLTDADIGVQALGALSVDILPDWYDDWVLLEVEDWRQLRMHALEALASHLMLQGRFGDAIRAAVAAVKADPLRESAHVVVMRVHLAEGNHSEAMHEFTRYSKLLSDELGLRPSSKLRDLASAIQSA